MCAVSLCEGEPSMNVAEVARRLEWVGLGAGEHLSSPFCGNRPPKGTAVSKGIKLRFRRALVLDKGKIFGWEARGGSICTPLEEKLEKETPNEKRPHEYGPVRTRQGLKGKGSRGALRPSVQYLHKGGVALD